MLCTNGNDLIASDKSQISPNPYLSDLNDMYSWYMYKTSLENIEMIKLQVYLVWWEQRGIEKMLTIGGKNIQVLNCKYTVDSQDYGKGRWLIHILIKRWINIDFKNYSNYTFCFALFIHSVNHYMLYVVYLQCVNYFHRLWGKRWGEKTIFTLLIWNILSSEGLSIRGYLIRCSRIYLEKGNLYD